MYSYRRLNAKQRAKLVSQRLERGYPPHSPPHPIADRELYLLTAACYEHQPYMNTDARRQQILDSLFEEFTNQGWEIRAWVILPNHYHILVKIDEFHKLGQRLRLIHGRTSYQWNQEDETRGRKIWYHYSDRAIRSERHYHTTLNYIHYNPVKHQWTSSPYNWTQTSVHWYLKHYGREGLRQSWVEYPVRDYGCNWDDI
ncbi:MAG: transposase [Cyanobacteriota bacterium]|nr:transposase [Cyanobacteriota bacterium]